MFYINAHENKNHEKQEGHLNRGKHIHDFKKNILEKLQKKKLIEYETKDILTEYKNCKINAKMGRVFTRTS